MPAPTITIPLDEYVALREVLREVLAVREIGKGTQHPIRAWNRLPAPLRLAAVNMLAHYESRGLDYEMRRLEAKGDPET